MSDCVLLRDAEDNKPENMSEEFDRAALIRLAEMNLNNSYAPYSEFNVSAALLMDSGHVYTGVNVENASYPAGMCAERNAVGQAISCADRNPVAIAIMGGRNGVVSDFCPPCGICRQVLREFADPSRFRVILAIDENNFRELTLDELLPESFGPDNLGK